jgi:hypothetical protein
MSLLRRLGGYSLYLLVRAGSAANFKETERAHHNLAISNYSEANKLEPQFVGVSETEASPTKRETIAIPIARVSSSETTSGSMAPTAKVTADVRAACTARAITWAERPSSSRA